MRREQKIIDSLIDWYRREPENIQVLSDLFGMCVHIENDDFEYAHKLNKTVRNERRLKMVINKKKGRILSKINI